MKTMTDENSPTRRRVHSVLGSLFRPNWSRSGQQTYPSSQSYRIFQTTTDSLSLGASPTRYRVDHDDDQVAQPAVRQDSNNLSGGTNFYVPKTPLPTLISMEGGATGKQCGEMQVKARPTTTGAEKLQRTRFPLSPGRPPILFKVINMIKQIEPREASQPHLNHSKILSDHIRFVVPRALSHPLSL